jgi:hypothetical protein
MDPLWLLLLAQDKRMFPAISLQSEWLGGVKMKTVIGQFTPSSSSRNWMKKKPKN